jgi:hypothetical protein
MLSKLNAFLFLFSPITNQRNQMEKHPMDTIYGYDYIKKHIHSMCKTNGMTGDIEGTLNSYVRLFEKDYKPSDTSTDIYKQIKCVMALSVLQSLSVEDKYKLLELVEGEKKKQKKAKKERRCKKI